MENYVATVFIPFILQSHIYTNPPQGPTDTSTSAIVTGASRGIGQGIALDLASRGAKVVITYSSDRSQKPAQEIVQQIKQDGSDAVEIQCDLSTIEAPQQIVDAAVKAFGHIDILVNNAGVISGTRLGDITPEHFADVFNLNVRAPLLMTQAVLPHLRRPGRIINISSVGSRQFVFLG